LLRALSIYDTYVIGSKVSYMQENKLNYMREAVA